MDGRNLPTLVDEIVKWGSEMGINNQKGEKGAKYRYWVEFAHRQVSATWDLIIRCIHIDGLAQDHMVSGRWTILQM